MKIKKYEVTDMKEALRMIKQDMGPEAVILSTRKVMKNNNFGLFARPVLEVTAAIDYKGPARKNSPSGTLSVEMEPEDNGYAAYRPSYMPKNRPDQPAATPPVKRRASQPEYDVDVPETAPYISGGASYFPGRGALYNPEENGVSENRYSPAPRPAFKPQNPRRKSEGEYSERGETPGEKSVFESDPKKVASVIKALGLDKLPGLMADIGDIKKQLEEVKTNISDNMVIDLPPKLKDYHSLLVRNGVDDIISYRFLKNLSRRVTSSLTGSRIKSMAAEALSELIIIEPDYPSVLKKRIIALAGPTGVGKTTTIAKIAATMALKYKRRVCLITADNFRIGAVEQLKTYAEIVNLPLYVAASPEELKRIIKDVGGNYDCVLLDSMGRSQFDAGQIENVGSFLKSDEAISVALVLSLASNHAELSDTLERYSPLSPEYLIFTKLDETRYFGPLVNLPVKKKIPLLLVTAGQNVPEDMEVPDGKKIARKVLQEIPTLWSDK